MKLEIIIFGLSITSSWGNGHATTYRALAKALAARGHAVTFIERDVPWYRERRDVRELPYCRVELYHALNEVPGRFGAHVRDAQLVILGSYVPDGGVLGDWITSQARGITAFYDIDTPVTLRRLDSDDNDYLRAATVPRFSLYLSFTGGPTLDLIEDLYGSPRARALHCAVDPQVHAPVPTPLRWELGYLGTYSEDRHPALERLLLEPARRLPERRFVVAGAQYPADIAWPDNVDRIEHLAPEQHAAFYCAQRYTLNLTRRDMAAAGFSPSVRLFEAAACGVPVISDRWPGIDTFFAPGREILTADTSENIVQTICETPEAQRRLVAATARQRVLREHTAEHRALQVEGYYREALAGHAAKRKLDDDVEAVA
jgi:spore maturation protein CgeB